MSIENQNPNKNNTLVVILLTIIATTLVLGAIYFLTNSSSQPLEKTKEVVTETNEQDIAENIIEESANPEEEKASENNNDTDLTETQDPKESVTEEAESIEAPLYQSGETIIISSSKDPWHCSINAEDCSHIYVTTEIDLTEDSTGKTLIGKLYIRAYESTDFEQAARLAEKQITQEYMAFAGDGGGVPHVRDTNEILTIENPNHSTNLSGKFNLEYLEEVPGWHVPGYILHLENKEGSTFDGRFVDFVYRDGSLSISFPQ